MDVRRNEPYELDAISHATLLALGAFAAWACADISYVILKKFLPDEALAASAGIALLVIIRPLFVLYGSIAVWYGIPLATLGSMAVLADKLPGARNEAILWALPAVAALVTLSLLRFESRRPP